MVENEEDKEVNKEVAKVDGGLITINVLIELRGVPNKWANFAQRVVQTRCL